MDKLETPRAYSTFHLFAKLPPELRIQTWYSALPDDLQPALYAYKKGCWRGRYLSPSEEDYTPDNNLNVEFRHDLLVKARVQLPLAAVNREARTIALEWAEMRKPRIYTGIEEGQLVFLRPFLPDRDALFLSDLDALFKDTWDELFGPDFIDRLLCVKFGIKRIALPKTLLQSIGYELSDLLFEHHYSVRALYIVTEMPSGQGTSTTTSPETYQLLWQCNGLHKVASWTRDGWDLDFSYPTWANDDCRQLVEQASQRLRPGLTDAGVREFEICLFSCIINPKL